LPLEFQSGVGGQFVLLGVVAKSLTDIGPPIACRVHIGLGKREDVFIAAFALEHGCFEPGIGIIETFSRQ